MAKIFDPFYLSYLIKTHSATKKNTSGQSATHGSLGESGTETMQLNSISSSIVFPSLRRCVRWFVHTF